MNNVLNLLKYRDSFKKLLYANKECVPYFEILSQREQDIYLLKLSGFTNKEISKNFKVHEKTIKFHYRNSCLKIYNDRLITNKPRIISSLIHIFYYNYVNKIKGAKSV